jgi:hypothetical protein
MMHGQKTIKLHILGSIKVFFNCVVYKRMWKNIEEPGKPQMTM